MKDKLDLFKRPWAITKDAFEILAGYDLEKCEHSPALTAATEDDFTEKLQFDEANGIAVLSISGPLMPSPSILARYFMGAIDSTRVEEVIRDAQSHPEVKALIVNLSTNGGTVTGVPELGNAVSDFSAQKPIFFFSNGTVASAGYWMAAPATELLGTPSSRWGSVGVIRPHVDLTEQRRKEGIAVELFTSGKHKAAGAMATSLTDEQREQIKDEVDMLGAKFRAHVSTHRPKITSDNMEAQVYYADEAVNNGYIDKLVPNFSAAIAYVSDVISEASSTPHHDPFKVDIATEETNPIMAKETNTEVEVEVEAEASAEVETIVETVATVEDESITEANEGDASDTVEAPAEEPVAAIVEDEVQTDSARIDSLDAKLDALLASLASPSPKPAADAEASDAEESADDSVAIAAARIAAESGVTPVDVTSEGDAVAEEAHENSTLSVDQLWEKYESIRADQGDGDARKFYLDNIQGK